MSTPAPSDVGVGHRRGRPPLTTEQLAVRRDSVADAARALFAEEGYTAVSIRRVADAAGVTPKTVYSYFDAKIDLLRYLWSDIFAALFDRLDVIAATPGDTHATLGNVCRAYVRYWIDHPQHYRLVFMSGDVSQGSVSIFLAHDAIGARFAIFARCLAGISGVDRRTVAADSEVLVCALHGIAHSHVTIGGYPWRAPELLVDRLVHALAPGRTAPRGGEARGTHRRVTTVADS